MAGQFEIGQRVLVRHSCFGADEVAAKVVEVRKTTIRVHYQYRGASGACTVKCANARPA